MAVPIHETSTKTQIKGVAAVVTRAIQQPGSEKLSALFDRFGVLTTRSAWCEILRSMLNSPSIMGIPWNKIFDVVNWMIGAPYYPVEDSMDALFVQLHIYQLLKRLRKHPDAPAKLCQLAAFAVPVVIGTYTAFQMLLTAATERCIDDSGAPSEEAMFIFGRQKFATHVGFLHKLAFRYPDKHDRALITDFIEDSGSRTDMYTAICSICERFVNVGMHFDLDDWNCWGVICLPPVSLKVSDIASQNFREEPTWVMLKPDPGVTKGTFAGFLNYRLSFMRANHVRVERPRLVEPSTTRMQLRFYLYQGTSLPAADDNGLSDPYCVLRWCGGSSTSKIVSESCHPLWYETVVLEVDAPTDLKYAPDVLVVCYDHDRMSADDALGAFSIPIKNLAPTRGTNYRNLPRPQWRPLVPLTGKRGSHALTSNGQTAPEDSGSVLAAFRLLPMGIAEALPVEATSIVPKSVECEVEVSVVGLRNLSKFRHMAIQRPFMEFDVGDRSQKTQVVRTVPSSDPSGTNPNFLQTLVIPARLPYDPLFCPTLNAKVFDTRMGGHSKPLIGTVSLWLETYMSWIPKTPGGPFEHRREPAPSPSPAELGAGVGSAPEQVATPREEPPPGEEKDKYALMFESDSDEDDDTHSVPMTAIPQTTEAVSSTSPLPAAPAPQPEEPSEKWDDVGPDWESEEEDDIEKGLLGDQSREDEATNHESAKEPESKPKNEKGGFLERFRAKKNGYTAVDTDLPVVSSGGELAEVTDDEASAEEEDVVFEDVLSRASGSVKGKSPKRSASRVRIRQSKTADPDDPVERHPVCDAELEKTFSTPDFFSVPIVSGQRSGKRRQRAALPSSLGGDGSVQALVAGGRGQSQVGEFKGQLRVLWEGAETLPPVDLATVFKLREYVVRAYVLKGLDLISKDQGGLSDPFVEIMVGNGKGEGQRIYDVEHKIMDTSNPEWFAVYQMPAVIPGDSLLTLTVYDWDAIGSNDLIGSTTIDLESRVFNKEWEKMEPKPREQRTLWSPQSSLPQGKIELWVDILTKEEAARTPAVHIGPPVPKPYDLRIVIWDTADCAAKDEKTESSDIYVACKMDMDDSKRVETDVHWKAKGEGLFNYRLILPVKIPSKVPRLRVAAWDKDLVGEDDLIGEAMLDLGTTFRKVERRKNHITSLRKQWITLRHPNFKEDQGRVLLSIDIVPEEMANENPVGIGQRDPNTDPHLDPPKRPPGAINPMRVDLVIAYHLKKAYRYALIAIIIIVGLLIAVLAYVVKKKVIG